jgi:hypothetical protein
VAVFGPAVFGIALLRAFVASGIVLTVAAVALSAKVNRIALLIVVAAGGAYLELRYSMGQFLFGDLAAPRRERNAITGSYIYRFAFLFVLGWIILRVRKPSSTRLQR